MKEHQSCNALMMQLKDDSSMYLFETKIRLLRDRDFKNKPLHLDTFAIHLG